MAANLHDAVRDYFERALADILDPVDITVEYDHARNANSNEARKTRDDYAIVEIEEFGTTALSIEPIRTAIKQQAGVVRVRMFVSNVKSGTVKIRRLADQITDGLLDLPQDGIGCQLTIQPPVFTLRPQEDEKRVFGQVSCNWTRYINPARG